MTYEPLSEEVRRWIAIEVASTAALLRTQPPHERWLDHHLDQLLWYWSVDRMRNGRVVRDVIAQGAGEGLAFQHASYTMRAKACHNGTRSKEIRRDHAVPKKVLRSLLATPAVDVQQLLDAYCFVVLIHVDEDAALNDARVRSCMPEGWHGGDLLGRDPWARYRRVPGLVESITAHSTAPPIC